MLPKKRRVSKQAFKNLQGSHSVTLPSFTLRIIRAEGPTRVAFVVSKKIAKTAVLRNKLRRRGYDVIRKIISRLKDGMLLVFYMKKESVTLSANDMLKEVEDGFKQKGFLKN